MPPVQSISSDSSNPKVQSASSARSIVGPFNLPSSQALSLNPNIRHETLIVPASSIPAFGSYFTVDIRERNMLNHNITLQFVTSPVVGTNLVGCFNPAWFWFTRVEVVQGSDVVDTYYNTQQFVLNQMLEYDEDRLSINNAAENYASTAQRTSLSSQTANNTVYCNLRTYFDQAKIASLTDCHNVQLRVYMDTLPNIFNVVSGTLISCSLLSCTAFCRVTRLDMNSASLRLEDMRVKKNHSVIHDTRYGTYTAPVGVTSTTIVLSAIVGNVAALFFTVRPSIVGANAFNFTQLANFSILDSASTNIVGGSALPASFAANILNKDWMKSSYNTETSFGTNNQNANVYMWSFSADPVNALTNGQCLSSRKMIGQEQLILNFTSALTTAVQIDVYAMTESLLEMTLSGVKKMSF